MAELNKNNQEKTPTSTTEGCENQKELKTEPKEAARTTPDLIALLDELALHWHDGEDASEEERSRACLDDDYNELDNLLEEHTRAIDDELTRQLDEEIQQALQQQLDEQMEEYFQKQLQQHDPFEAYHNELDNPLNFPMEEDPYWNDFGWRQQLANRARREDERSSSPTVQDINANIQKVVDQYNKANQQQSKEK